MKQEPQNPYNFPQWPYENQRKRDQKAQMKMVPHHKYLENIAKAERLQEEPRLEPIKVENFETADSTRNTSDSDDEMKAMEPSMGFGLTEILEIT